MRTIDTRTRLEVIELDECIELLGTEEVGRVGFLNGGTVEVLPVNYVLDGESVTFATAAGAKLWNVERGEVTFEVDHIDGTSKTGWSVVMHGNAHVLSRFEPPAVLERLRSLTLNSWARGSKPNIVQITPRTITGRRII